MKLQAISRCVYVGGSEAGKTFTFYKGLMFQNMYPFPTNTVQLKILSPSKESLHTYYWDNLKFTYPDIKIEKYHILSMVYNKDEILKVDKKRNVIILIDDFDGKLEKAPPRKKRDYVTGMDFVQNIFSVQSHHSNCSVVLICHNLKNKAKETRISAQYLFFFQGCQKYLKSYNEEFGYSTVKIKKILEDQPLVSSELGNKKYGCVVFRIDNLYRDNGSPISKYMIPGEIYSDFKIK